MGQDVTCLVGIKFHADAGNIIRPTPLRKGVGRIGWMGDGVGWVVILSLKFQAWEEKRKYLGQGPLVPAIASLEGRIWG